METASTEVKAMDLQEGFVWFHNSSENLKESASFYERLFGWKGSDGPSGMKMFAGAKGPFAGAGSKDLGVTGWVPYVQVKDLKEATTKAKKLGAEVVKDTVKGPAGTFTVVRDPGGAAVALWEKSAQ